MDKIDKRRHYILVIDTETANTIQIDNKLDMSNVLVYDCGWQVVDTHGTVYAESSYVNKDIFIYEKDLMQSAYYAKKIPQYEQDLIAGTRVMADTYTIRKAMLDDMKKFNIIHVAAHNAYFDWNALNVTRRYVSKSKFRYWFPYETEFWDTMRMADSVICKMPTYIKFCEDNNFVTESGKPRKTAEVLWRYITNNPDFVESHTGLEDVQIEAQIMAYCFRQHKPMEKKLFKQEREKTDPPTPFQIALMRNIREHPTL